MDNKDSQPAQQRPAEESEDVVHELDLDHGARFLRESSETAGTTLSDPAMRQLRRKIDLRIVPILLAIYVVGFMDKIIFNYAAIMGLNRDLKLTGNDFSNSATAFFVAYLLASAPNAYFLQKTPVAKWLGANVILWGITVTCTASAHNYHELLAVRIILGIFEAAMSPSLILISSMFYTKSEQAPRFAIWYCGLGLGQIIGGLVSFAFQQIHIPSFAGWRLMFVILGIVTIVVGVATVIWLPDTPMTAQFLTRSEKVQLLLHVSINKTGIENHHIRPAQILDALLDVQLWFLCFIAILVTIPSGAVTTYSATLIKSFGFSAPISALLNIPSGVVSLVTTLAIGFGVRHTSHRWAWIVGSFLFGVLGGGLLSYTPLAHKAGWLAGIYLINGIVGILMLLYQWTAANCAGHTKRAVSAVLISASFGIGNIIGPQTFQAKDAPNYRPAKVTIMASQVAGAILTIILYIYYVWANRRKDSVQVEMEITEKERWGNLTDKQNRSFRYVY